MEKPYYGFKSDARSLLKATLIAAILLCAQSLALGQFWQQMKSPPANINVLKTGSNNQLFAGTQSNGIFVSMDGGNTWLPRNSGLENRDVRAIVVNQAGDIFAAVNGGGIFKSTDNGNSWEEANNNFPSLDVLSIQVAPNGWLFAGTALGQIVLSMDNGDSWTTMQVFPNTSIKTICINAVGEIFFDSNTGLRRSTDNGMTWTAINSGLPTTNQNTFAISPNGDLYVATRGGGGFYRSTNKGNSWIWKSSGVSGANITALNFGGNGLMYAGTTNSINQGKIYTSSNNGSSFTSISGNYTSAGITQIITDQQGNIFAGGAGIFRSVNNGASWADATSNLAAFQNVNTLDFTSTGNIFTSTNLGIFRSTDNGQTWDFKTAGMANTSQTVSVAVAANGNVIAGTTDPRGQYGANLYLSTDGGNSFTSKLSGFNHSEMIKKGSNGELYASPVWGSPGGIYKSTNNGVSWTQICNVSPGLAYDFAFHPSGSMFAATEQKGINKSTNNGVNWATVKPLNQKVFSVGVSLDGVVYAATDGSSVLKSSDNGATWTTMLADEAVINSIVVASPSNYVYAGTPNGLYISVDNGATWTKTNGGLKNVRINKLVIGFGGYLYAATPNGIFKSAQAVQQNSQQNVLNAPALSLPANAAENQAVAGVPLSWSAVQNATGYHLQVATASDFSAASLIVNDSLVSATFKNTPQLAYNTMYFWRVRAYNQSLKSAWSSAWSFKTAAQNQTLAAPVLSAPVNSAVSQTIPLTLSWNSVQNATLYEYQVATNSTFPANTIVLHDSGSALLKQFNGNYATQYFWRVRAKNNSSVSNWSQTWSFATQQLNVQNDVAPANPILFVTQVPITDGFTTITSVFGNHRGDMNSAPRGGDLYIRYPDGSLKNLTAAAGYGISGQQQTGANAIAVREPSVHWNGTKAIFSMVKGASSAQYDTTKFYWQLYEITGLGKNETPVITKVPNQPVDFNNVSPIYGTDDKIIFTSDRPRNGARHLHPQLDEYERAPVNSGLWSLNPTNGELVMLDHSPSGDYSPTIDSYGRVIFTRWDHLQRDQEADSDFGSGGTSNYGSFNYSDESANAQIQFGVMTEVFPEPRRNRPDLLAGTNIYGHDFNHFFPWQINEDGSEAETINHVGRHDLHSSYIDVSFTDDPNLKSLTPTYSSTKNYLRNFMEMHEDPLNPGVYFGIDAPEFSTHASGQIITLTGPPTMDPMNMTINYITPQATRGYIEDNGTATPNNTGHYRNPLPMSNGALVASHTAENRAEKNEGTSSNPISRYDFRLKTLQKVGSYYQPSQTLTAGISKSVTWWTNGISTSFSGNLWELNPVEVVARTKPAMRTAHLPTLEEQVLNEEGVDETNLKKFLKRNNTAIVVSRDVTNRNTDDTHQPYFLKVHNSAKQSPNATGKIYTIAHAQYYQADQIRGGGMYNQNSTPRAGRRVLAQPMHDPAVLNPSNPGGPTGSVKIASDGSIAAIVPAHRAMTWQLTDTAAVPVVRERFWLTFKAGEIRVCASCHGQNDFATSPKQSVPQNKPQALRNLLQFLKAQATGNVTLVSPANDSANVALNAQLKWNETPVAAFYQVQVSTDSTFANTVINNTDIATNYLNIAGLSGTTKYYWRVRATTLGGTGYWSQTWSFTTAAGSSIISGVADFTPDDGKFLKEIKLDFSPHPAQDFTNISFEFFLKDVASLPVKIEVFDATGNKVTILYDGESPLQNSIVFSTRNLASGTYYCKIESGGMSVVRKLVIDR